MPVIDYVQALAAALLVGKVALLSFVVAPILAKTLAPEPFGLVVRRLFPAYYALGIVCASAGLAALTAAMTMAGWTPARVLTGAIWLVVLIAESYCRFLLTPASNAMRDQLKQQEAINQVDPALQAAWNGLHQRSVMLNSVVLLAGLALVGLAK